MRQRKKLDTETTAPISAPEPKKRTTKKTEEPIAEAIVEETRPKKSRAKSPVAKAVEAVGNLVKTRKRAPKVESVPEPEAVVVSPKPTRTRKKAEPVPVVEEEDDFGGLVSFRKREAPAKAAPVAVAETPAKVEKTPRGRKPKAADEDSELAALLAEFKVAPLEWRAPSARPASAKTVEPETDEARGDDEAPTRGKNGRGRGRRGRDRDRDRREEKATVTAPIEIEIDDDEDLPVVFRNRDGKEAAPPAPKVEPKPELPVKPIKPLIPIPVDAPQVVLRDGIPTLVRNHRVYPPFAFFGSAQDEQRADIVLNEMRMAGEAGVHLHSHMVDFEVDPRSVDAAVALAAYLLKKTIEVDAEAQVLFRVVFVAPSGWSEKYPNGRYRDASGQTAEPSFCDDDFWAVARECLHSFVTQLKKLPMADHILGLHLDRGEWFNAEASGYDTSKAARLKFQDWARMRYFNDIVALRASWFDGSARFEDLQIPEHPGKGHTDKFVRANRKERPWVDYHLFLSDQTVERIADLAYTAKEASAGYFLVGVSYGYTFEWNHPASGHLSLGKLLRTPEVDFIAGPPSYRDREPGGAASFPCPIDSLALNGKLYISEEDFKTSIGAGYEPDDFNPTLKTPQALDSVHWRGVGAALAHQSGVCWMDLWGNGWLKTHSTWDRAGHVRDALIRRMGCPTEAPDVAVFIDERALAYLVDQQGFGLLVHNVRESVMRAGMSAGFYLLSDLQHRENFPESKLYVFLNAWDIRPELRAAIKQRLQRDNKVLFWLYSAGLFDSGRESLERAREVTGIALKPQPFHSRTGTTILNRRHPLCEALPDQATIGGARLEPSYFAIPDDGVVLGEYTQTGLPSFVLRQFRFDHDRSQNWSSVFLGEPIVTPGLLRALGQMAGAHVWNFTEDVVHVRAPFLTVHCKGAGQRTITLPQKWSAYDLTEQTWVSTDSTSLRFHGTDGSTHVFMVGVREELEHILSRDPAELLHLETVQRTADNTVRYDAAFDVPIMRLDEWMEGNEGDEGVGEDLLFKPRLIEEETVAAIEEPNRVGRRRRRGRGRGGSEETASARREGADMVDPDLDLGVMFRKRN